MIINHNITALNTHNKLSSASAAQGKSMEKLASGLRINRAGDDAAGLAISEKMRAQVRGLDQASRNAQDGISMIQTAEGALTETHDILQRMRELSVQSANDTTDGQDREAIGQELKDLTVEMNRISKTTEFNGKKLLNGSLTSSLDALSELKVGTTLSTTGGAAVSKVDVSNAIPSTYTLGTGSGVGKIELTRADGVKQEISLEATIGADGVTTLNFDKLGVSIEVSGASTKAAADLKTDLLAAGNDTITVSGNGSAEFAIGSNNKVDDKMTVSFDKFDDTTLGNASKLSTLVTAKAANAVVATNADSNALTSSLDDAIKQVSTQRSKLGASQNRLEHTINNLKTSSENVTAAESRIRDVDMAKEMMNQTKNSILAQAAQAMLAQANQAPQGVLQLLR